MTQLSSTWSNYDLLLDNFAQLQLYLEMHGLTCLFSPQRRTLQALP